MRKMARAWQDAALCRAGLGGDVSSPVPAPAGWLIQFAAHPEGKPNPSAILVGKAFSEGRADVAAREKPIDSDAGYARNAMGTSTVRRMKETCEVDHVLVRGLVFETQALSGGALEQA
ncbi:hypothetical protein [Rhizobium terrae]|uniref:hypothetical protein n=1 Tax=Rhizobium terrae TaxID=2171756 RepID=UPI000E3CDD24|nr:hypothetical protein [Rhizobium terrae]